MNQEAVSGNKHIDLIEAIETKLSSVHTQSLDLSFNELTDMHRTGELDIRPDYQRLFQWTEGAQSRFIESLLLEMPVPPIYVVEEDAGRYLLIDGLQRISSYLHLRGELNASHLEPAVALGDKLTLSDCDIVPELNGRTFDELPTALQIRLKRAFVRVEVVRKGSDARFKYHMFKRLNTGGQVLTPQQLRNCTIRLLDPTFNDFIITLSQDEAFRVCTQTITTERKLGAFDQELVLRFFALKNWRVSFKHDVSDFLTEYMERVSDPEPARRLSFDYSEEEKIFRKTFGVLASALGPDSFAYANPARTVLVRGFSVYHFEAFSVGIQGVLPVLNRDDKDAMQALGIKLRSIKMEEQFIGITTGGGKNSPGPLKERIEAVEKKLGDGQ
jgi:hypothetical protein